MTRRAGCRQPAARVCAGWLHPTKHSTDARPCPRTGARSFWLVPSARSRPLRNKLTRARVADSAGRPAHTQHAQLASSPSRPAAPWPARRWPSPMPSQGAHLLASPSISSSAAASLAISSSDERTNKCRLSAAAERDGIWFGGGGERRARPSSNGRPPPARLANRTRRRPAAGQTAALGEGGAATRLGGGKVFCLRAVAEFARRTARRIERPDGGGKGHARVWFDEHRRARYWQMTPTRRARLARVCVAWRSRLRQFNEL
jgi:hypothetical protein